MQRLLFSVSFLCLFIATGAQKTGKRELRGAWITTYLGLDWPVRTQTPDQQRAALTNILNGHRTAGFNTVYFQVRSQSDAMYPSTLEPWSYDLTGNQGVAPNPLWDPLQFALTESRKRGFEFHAWLNPFRAVANTANANNTAQFAPTHISKTQPGWMLTVGTVQILNPGLPEVRTYITEVIVDILKRYDIDGVHFDDYFYPTGMANAIDDAAYTADPRGFPATTTGRADWRRDNINLFIKRVNDSIIKLKPWVKFGVSPTGIYRSSTDPAVGSNTSSGALQHYSAYFADTRKWLQEGWVDYIAPQAYWHIGQTGSDYGVLVPWWNNNAFGRHIYMGMAAYKVNDGSAPAWGDPSQIHHQLRMNRSNTYPNVWGSIYFRTQHINSNPLGMRDSLRLHLFNKPALQPTMPWKDNAGPQQATSLTATKFANDSVVLKWIKPANASNELDKVRQFAIYRATSAAIDINDPANLLAITTNDTTGYRDETIVPNTTYYYAITALDRLHNESIISNVASNATVTSVTGIGGVSNELSITVGPNPSTDRFLLRLGARTAQRITISVTNITGQPVESILAIAPGSTISLGATYAPGVYVVEGIQGENRSRVILVKLR